MLVCKHILPLECQARGSSQGLINSSCLDCQRHSGALEKWDRLHGEHGEHEGVVVLCVNSQYGNGSYCAVACARCSCFLVMQHTLMVDCSRGGYRASMEGIWCSPSSPSCTTVKVACSLSGLASILPYLGVSVDRTSCVLFDLLI